MVTVKSFVKGYFKRHQKAIIIIIIIASFGAILASIIPYLYGRLFDLAVVPNSPINLLLSLIGVWFVLSLISNFINNKVGLMGLVVGSKISLEAEAEAYGHFLTLPIPFHKKQKRGEVLNKISRGTWNLNMLVERVSEVLPQFFMFVFSMIAMFIIKWQLTLILIPFFIIYATFTLKKTKRLLKLQKKESRAFEKHYGEVYNKLYNVYVVKNFAMEEREKKNFLKSLVKKLLPVFSRNQKEWNSFSIIQDFIFTLCYVSLLGSAILFLRSSLITPGEFIMFFGYIHLAFGPFRRLSSVYRRFKRASIGIKRVVRLKNLVPEAMKHGNKKIKEVKGEIIFDDIDFAYAKNKDVLEDISLKINAGESIALVGKSGVGKTTLSELIIGYYNPKKGKIYLDGIEISKLDLKWLRDQIAIVPQDINLFNDTILNNLRYSKPKATLKEVKRAAKAAYADEFIEKLPKKYNTIVGEEGIKLSMGQRQRMAIAMAFLKDPKILILDEPTSALDAESEKKVKESIERLIKKRTTIIIAHRFSTVRNVDKIVVLDKRRIVEVGNHKELLKKGSIYYNLYTLQAGLK